MAESTILAFGTKKLGDLLVRESERFQGVKEQYDNLKKKVDALRGFLKDAEAKKKTEVQEIREIVYDAEDVIEKFLMMEEPIETSSIMRRVIRFFCGILETRELAFEMEGINKRISNVILNLKSFGVEGNSNDEQNENENETEKAMRREFAYENINEDVLVGLEENIKMLVDYLVEEDNSQIVSIIGMGGIGKTTLAREIYNHEIVKDRFEGRAWVCVTQQCKKENVWQEVLRQLTKVNEVGNEVYHMREAELQEKLFKLLQTQKALIVFDDIWKELHWDIIQKIFPRERGWKVLLTSRNESVALRRERKCFIFKPNCLTFKESWTLFQRIAFPREIIITQDNIDEKMEELGKEMIEYCGGLPLAIIVLGGLLAEKYTLQYWERVSTNIGSHLIRPEESNDDKNRSLYHILSLSFEALPSNLKYCFLYLAHFPEDYEISVEKLSCYWVAEGILEPSNIDGETFVDIGHHYIEKLVRRNMVISERNSTSLKFETCHLHDMMREICLYKAKEENFLQIHGIPFPTTSSQSRIPTTSYQSRRSVWQYPETLNIEKDINNPKLRSLLTVFDIYGTVCVLSGLRFTKVQRLRILDLSHTVFETEKLHDSIGKLIYLRYLSLEGVVVWDLPSSLGKLKLLVYLNIQLNFLVDSIFVPNVFMEMKELRYLGLPINMDEKTKLELSNLKNLETLLNFSTKNCNLEDIQGMTKLRTLNMTLTDEASLETVYAAVAELRHLEVFEIHCSLHTYPIYEMKIEEMGFFLNMVKLKNLSLVRMYMKRLPSQKHFPPHLTSIYLFECELKEDPMPILEKFLHLREVVLERNSFGGRRMVCLSGGFPQLHKLSISSLDEWEEWVIEEGSMPLLHTLLISRCIKLKELPRGLPFLYSLKNLIIYCCGEEWKDKLSERGEDYYKVKHIPSVMITSYDLAGRIMVEAFIGMTKTQVS